MMNYKQHWNTPTYLSFVAFYRALYTYYIIHIQYMNIHFFLHNNKPCFVGPHFFERRMVSTFQDATLRDGLRFLLEALKGADFGVGRCGKSRMLAKWRCFLCPPKNSHIPPSGKKKVIVQSGYVYIYLYIHILVPKKCMILLDLNIKLFWTKKNTTIWRCFFGLGWLLFDLLHFSTMWFTKGNMWKVCQKHCRL